MQEPETWRELLKIIISDAQERQRIAEELGVQTITLLRWATGESDPRPQNLHHLLNAVPQYRRQLLELIRAERPDFVHTGLEVEDPSKIIPPAFYARAFRSRASTIESVRFWSTCKLVLQQAIGQLDPDKIGMSITVVRCMPPSPIDNKVHSLRESAGVGTPPWGAEREQNAMLLGAESLCGYVVTFCRPASNQNIKEEHNLIPAHPTPYEKSASVYPILFAGRVAGALLVSSTQYNYFESQARLSLIEHYANLIAIAFEPEDFHDPANIQLHIMPGQEVQKKYLANFRQRVAQLLIDSVKNKEQLSHVEAEQQVWQQLELELSQVPSQPLYIGTAS